MIDLKGWSPDLVYGSATEWVPLDELKYQFSMGKSPDELHVEYQGNGEKDFPILYGLKAYLDSAYKYFLGERIC